MSAQYLVVRLTKRENTKQEKQILSELYRYSYDEFRYNIFFSFFIYSQLNLLILVFRCTLDFESLNSSLIYSYKLLHPKKRKTVLCLYS